MGSWRIPAKSALFRARNRLGSEPLRVMFAPPRGRSRTLGRRVRSGVGCGWWRWTARAGMRPIARRMRRSSAVR
ncbi:transposase domain-containing protein [Streptomyces sp. 7N604]|uniref:transposase domain-containing protein n=1 Tax=Streptomyces sp. 7N604 TaxID=3457415 RepID=UPI003FD05F13